MAEARNTPRGLRAGLAILGLLATLALTAPMIATDLPWLARDGRTWISPAWSRSPAPELSRVETWLHAPIRHDPRRMDLTATLQPPSLRHWMGTDAIGRDIAARLVHGTRVSLAVGLLSAFFALAIGLPVGGLAGYRGGWWDAASGRLIEALLCFPGLLLVLTVLTSAPPALRELPELLKISLVLGVTGWIPTARYVRAEFLKLKTSDQVLAARALGAGRLRLAVCHILPRAAAPVLVTASFGVSAAIVLEASLSFLGLGIQPPVPTWGGLLAEAREHVHRAWWLALYPGAAVFLAVLACNLVGEGLRDLLDPRSRSR